MADRQRTLTAKEEEIMRIFWEHGPLLIREIVDLLPDPKPHVNTVSTVVRILEQKGAVGHEKEGGSFRYHALLPKESYRRSTLGEMLRNYFDNSCQSMVSTLVEEEKMSVDDLRELIDIIEKKK